MKNCLSGEDSRAGTLETLLAGLALSAGCDSTIHCVYAELSITGLARYLSHAELLRALERACVRAGVDLHYSQGFNPRPQMSLPLPKSVGVESVGDVLVLRVRSSDPSARPTELAEACRCRLADHLPEGISLLSVRVTGSRSSLQPSSARWTIPCDVAGSRGELAERVHHLLARDTILIERSRPSQANKTKRKDIRRYLASIEAVPEGIRVDYRITPLGSVRLDEVLELLGLTRVDLTGPVRRTHIRWRFH